MKVIRAGFGRDKKVCATIFQEESASSIPVRLVAIHLDWPRQEEVRIESISSSAMLEDLQELNRTLLDQSDPAESRGIFYQRIARIYDTVQVDGRSVPTIYLVKPDQIRYWTRSIALRDADDVAADIMLWQQGPDSIPDHSLEAFSA